MTIDAALRAATARLASASDSPRLDAEILMAQALDLSREALLLGGREGAVPAAFADLVDRRADGEPVAYLVGRQAFWTIDLVVGPDVLIPRPDSETLIEVAIGHFANRAAPRRILDLGTGSGALLLAALAEWPAATGLGIDISPAALVVAQGNAERLGLAGRTEFAEGTWIGDPQADLILCNPPYIATDEQLPRSVAGYEPAGALWAGTDGLDAYRAIAAVLDFADDGLAAIEIGHAQGRSAADLFRDRGFDVAVRRDLAARDRCLVVTRR